MLGTSRIAAFFQWFVVPGSKSRLAKAAGAEVAVQQRNEKWHAAVARSTFSSENAQNTTITEQFLKCSSGKMVRHCGAKPIFKWKCTSTTIAEQFLVLIRKNGTPLWREARLQVKMYKIRHCGNDFGSSDLKKWHAALARSAFVSQNATELEVWATFGRSEVQKWHAISS